MTAAQYFYAWVSELTGSAVCGQVRINLSAHGSCNDTLTVGGVVVAKGARAAQWYQAAPAEICE